MAHDRSVALTELQMSGFDEVFSLAVSEFASVLIATTMLFLRWGTLEHAQVRRQDNSSMGS